MEYSLTHTDIHLHIMEPHSLVPEPDFQPPTLENAHTVVAILEQCGLQQACIPAITLYEQEDLPCNPLALYAKTLQPQRIFALAGLRRSCVREENAGMAQQAKELLEAGFDGFKMICKPNALRRFAVPIDDSIFDDFYRFAEAQQVPILFHVGDPESFWDADKVPDWAVQCGWYYGGEGLPTMPELYGQVEHVLRQFPLLRITFAHFYFTSANLAYAQELLEQFPNVRFDITPGSEMYLDFSQNHQQAVAFFKRWAGRILFGTDNVGVNGAAVAQQLAQSLEKVHFLRRFFEEDCVFPYYGAEVRGLGLDAASLEALYSGSFRQFLGTDCPAAVDTARAAALCAQYRHGLEADSPTATLLKQLEEVFLAQR